MALFNEQTLRDEIVAKWGEYGAHAEVYDDLLKRLAELEAEQTELLGRLETIYEECLSTRNWDTVMEQSDLTSEGTE